MKTLIVIPLEIVHQNFNINTLMLQIAQVTQNVQMETSVVLKVIFKLITQESNALTLIRPGFLVSPQAGTF